MESHENALQTLSESQSFDSPRTPPPIESSQVTVWSALKRGWHRRCPRCGEAPLFGRWFSLEEECSACGLCYEQNPGDTWGFWLIGDRLFLAILIIAVFLVFRSDSVYFGFFLLVVTAVPLVVTMPHRMGVCIALDFLSRSRWGDLAQSSSARETVDSP